MTSATPARIASSVSRRASSGVEPLVVVGRDADDRAPLGLEPREVGRLVLVPLPEDQVAMRRVQVRPLELAAHDTDRERRQVRAGEVRREVGG